MAATYLGIDLGTSGLKAVLMTADQRILATSTVATTTDRPAPLWSEQNPDDWWRVTERAVAELRQQAPAAFAQLGGIGLSGQMHGAVLLGRDDRPLRPAILWNDGRAAAECATITARVPDFAAIAGTPVFAGSLPPKLLWLARHEPQVLEKLHKLMLPKDYIRLCLTGTSATDCCDAAGGLLLDEAARDWSTPILAACGLSRAQLPDLAEGPEVTGHLRASIAEAWGVAPVPVAAGAGDAAAGAIGIGAVGADDAYIALGTGAQIFVSMDRYRPAPGSALQSLAHGLPGRWFQSAAVMNGASALAWACQLLGRGDDITGALAETEAAFDGPGRLIFLPYLAGERLPHNDPHAKGMLFGLTPETGRTDVLRSVLEGITFTLHAAQQCLQAAGTEIETAAVVGGGARSAFWTRLIAAILNRPIIRYAGADAGPAFGAARLGLMAATGADAATICTKPPILDVTAPDLALHAAYGPRIERFAGLYHAVRPYFTPVAAAGGV